jgi:hypothetical protein
MDFPQPMSMVFRFPAVAVSRDVLEAMLAMTLDSFEPLREGPLSYATINVPEEGDAWTSAVTLAQCLGPAISALVERGEMGQSCVDIAMLFHEERMTASLFIPSPVALALGRWGFHIEVSVYLTGPD